MINGLQSYGTDSGILFYRPGTSDLKAIQEVCDKHGYERKGFSIAAGERWLDLGANVGAFTVYAARRGAYVTAFEPDPDHFEILKRNVGWNSVGEYVELIQAGVGGFNTDAVFHRNTAKGNTWRNSFLKEWKGGDTITASLKDIRLYIEPNTCIKMDIEGGELAIFSILIEENLLQYIPKLVFEWSFDILPQVSDFLEVINDLKVTHDLMGVTDAYLMKLSRYDVYPPSWFPPCVKVFGVRW